VVGSAAQGGRAETKTAARQTGRRAMEGAGGGEGFGISVLGLKVGHNERATILRQFIAKHSAKRARLARIGSTSPKRGGAMPDAASLNPSERDPPKAAPCWPSHRVLVVGRSGDSIDQTIHEKVHQNIS
jgi:hypothetical protein